MPRYAAFLRAVNVGGPRTVKMDVLRRAFEDFGFSNVTSYIASGNIIFESAARNTGLLERKIEKSLLQALGQDLTPFVRTAGELVELAAFDAFPGHALHSGDQFAVIFLSAPPDAAAVNSLQDSRSSMNEFRVHGREVYWLRHLDAAGAYSPVPLDRAFGEPFTIRSMSTVKKIAAKFFSYE